MTHFVPPRHVYGRNGKPKTGESVTDQVIRELKNQGFPEATVVNTYSSEWIKIHRPFLKKAEPPNWDKRGYNLEIELTKPVSGPLAIGHSCHFGLGLFVPVST